MKLADLFRPSPELKRLGRVFDAAPISKEEMAAGLLCPDDSPLLRSIVAIVQGERQLCLDRMANGGLSDPQLREEAGRLAMLADIQADIGRGRLKAREEARRRAAR